MISIHQTASITHIRGELRNRLNDWAWVGWVLACMAALIVAFQQSSATSNMVWVGTLGGALVLARCLFYCLIDGWLNWGLLRYVQPNVLVGLFTAVCLSFVLGGWLAHSRSYLSGR